MTLHCHARYACLIYNKNVFRMINLNDVFRLMYFDFNIHVSIIDVLLLFLFMVLLC